MKMINNILNVIELMKKELHVFNAQKAMKLEKKAIAQIKKDGNKKKMEFI